MRPPRPTNYQTRGARSCRRRSFGALEQLESRRLLSSAFSADEVYLAELINRARMDPQAEEVRLGFDLSGGLSDEQLALLGPVEPLALDLSLAAAARDHSLDMAYRGYFDDIDPDGLNPTQRAQAAGYPGVAGESIASGHNSIDALYEAWMYTPENRANILSLIPAFDESFHYDQMGFGFATDLGFADNHYTAMFGDPGAGSSARLLGVVYDDLDGDGFYSVGEGLPGVRIDVAEASRPDAVIASFTTDDAGNYQLKLGDGSWLVTFTDLATGWVVEKGADTSGRNVKLDATADEFAAPDDGGGDGGGGGGSDGGDGGTGGGSSGGDGGGGGTDDGGGTGDSGGTDGGGGDSGGGSQDDHADDGDYANAANIPLAQDHTGSSAGIVESESDTDLFYFTADQSGPLALTLNAPGGDLIARLTLKSDAGLALAVEQASGPGESITLAWNIVEGRQYFIVVGAAGSTGEYGLSLQTGSARDDGGGGGDSGGSGGDGDGGGGGSDGGSDDSSGDSSGDGSGGTGDQPQDDPPVDATSDDSGSFIVVRRDDNGNPVLYLQEQDGSWSRVDLIGQAGGPSPEGRYATFVDPSTGSASVVSATHSGLAIYSRDASGEWMVRNLSAELGAAPIVSKPVTFTTRSGLIYAAGLDESGNLVAYHHTGEDDGSGGTSWAFVDISGVDLAASGVTMPALAGATLIAYVTPWNALTIAGLDPAGRVYAAWWAPGRERWTLADLSGITGAPGYRGTISAYLTPWNGINIAGTDVNGDLSVVWWVPSFGGEWKLSKLNQILGGPRLGEGTIASWVTPWGGLNVSGLTADGRVVVYWWTPGSGGWQITALSDYIPGVEPPTRGVIGHTSQTGVISILGLSDAGDLVRYWWRPGQSWEGELLPGLP